jgi:hypothetical protein
MWSFPIAQVRSELPPHTLLVFDGTESISGRALLTISSLYWAPWAHSVRIRFIDVNSPDVLLALQALRWDLGLDVEVFDAPDGLMDATLYAGICFRSANQMRLGEARKRSIPIVLALQYPEAEWLSASVLIHEESAFDPKGFADHVGAVIRALS